MCEVLQPRRCVESKATFPFGAVVRVGGGWRYLGVVLVDVFTIDVKMFRWRLFSRIVLVGWQRWREACVR